MAVRYWGETNELFVFVAGLRHVPEEEDQVRRQDAQVFALYQLQDRLRIHTSGKETESTKRVCAERSMTDVCPFACIALTLDIRIVPSTLRD